MPGTPSSMRFIGTKCIAGQVKTSAGLRPFKAALLPKNTSDSDQLPAHMRWIQSRKGEDFMGSLPGHSERDRAVRDSDLGYSLEVVGAFTSATQNIVPLPENSYHDKPGPRDNPCRIWRNHS
jgi:hypothetical protein